MFIELKNTTIGYDLPLIKGINTSLDLGQIALLMGNNGVGKTTLIKTILNQILPINGEIILNGKSTKFLSHKEMAEQIAVVFSKSFAPANYTVRDLISLGKYIHYPYYFELNSDDQYEVEEIIYRLNLTPYIDFPLNQLSDGNLQKTFIGRALAQNSPIIILDEPTTHLDEQNKIIILQLLRSLAKKENKLILFSSHDWRLAKEFADCIWLLHDQKIDAGIAEDILLRNHQLLNPQLFQLADEYLKPNIIAPDLEKEMLYSFLQKNFQKNLKNLKFELLESNWVISNNEIQQKCKSFEEIGKFIQNHH